MSIKADFQDELNAEIAKVADYQAPIVTDETIAHLPDPMRRFYKYCGYLGRELCFNAYMEYRNTYLKIWEGSEYAQVEAYHYTSALNPLRLVYLYNRILGFIPLAAKSVFRDGVLDSKVRILSVFTPTFPKGKEQNEASLADVLGDTVLAPGIALHPSIQWIDINENTARAVMNYAGLEVSGIFRFNDAGECIEYDTEDRSYQMKDMTTVKVRSTTRFEHYHEVEGMRQPSGLKQYWHLATGDFEYAKAEYARIRHNVREPIQLDR